jgi:methyl-accepting chemotaxis protein
MLRHVSTGKRIYALIAIMVLFIAGVVFGFLNNAKKTESVALQSLGDVMLSGQKDKLKVVVSGLAQTLSEQLASIPDAAAREEHIRTALNTFFYEEDKSGYVFALKGNVYVAMPPRPDMVGKDGGNVKDKNGVEVSSSLFKAAQDGGGYVQYVWPKPGSGEQPKISYAVMIPGTDYWLGSGVYIDNIKARQDAVSKELDDLVQESTTLILSIIGGLFLLVVLPASLAIVRSIVLPIRAATAAAGRISEGDLTVTLEQKGADEAAQLEGALNVMADTLKKNIAEITEKTREAEHKAQEAQKATRKAEAATRQAQRAKSEGMFQAAVRLEAIVERVSAASEEISNQSEEIRQGSEVQSERIASTATAMEEMNATVLEVARNSGEAASVGEDAKEKAVRGAEVVERSVEAMLATQRQTEELSKNMTLLGEQAQAIGSVMNVINDIADQTNLLALNAAIEAARAGEAGRGFAVVADEVRKLAEKTMAATKEVGDSIKAIQHAAQSNIKSMETSVEDMGKAVDLATESGEVLKEIVSSVENSAGQIQGIATAAEEQSATSEEINRAIEEISRITMDTARGVAESAEALRELAQQAGALSGLIAELKAEGDGGNGNDRAGDEDAEGEG